MTTPQLETPTKILEESSRDSGFSNSVTKMTFMEEETVDFTEIIASTSYSNKNESKISVSKTETYVPQSDQADIDSEFETLHDLDEEFENDNFDECSKYEIISTDSPNIISRGNSSRKITSKNLVYGAPISESETSTSFNKINFNATRMLNFDEETFDFPSPSQRPKVSNIRKSLNFSKTEENSKLNLIKRDLSNSSIGSSISSPVSCKSSYGLFPSKSTQSMESGFVSEIEDTILEIEESSNSPKIPNFTSLLSGQIKTDVHQRPTLQRSISHNLSRAKTSLFSTIFESPGDKRSFNSLECEEEGDCKRRRNCEEPPKRPVLQRAYSENAASIMSALARCKFNFKSTHKIIYNGY